MKSIKDDELNDVSIPVTTADEANPAAAVVQPSTAAIDDDGCVDLVANYEDLKAKATLPNVLPKEQNRTVRFALVKGVKAYSKPTHFLAGVNSKGLTVVCPGANCPECSQGGDHAARRKVVALAIKYETGTDGKFAAGTTKPALSIGHVTLSPTAYTELSDCPSEGEDIYSIDYKATRSPTISAGPSAVCLPRRHTKRSTWKPKSQSSSPRTWTARSSSLASARWFRQSRCG